MDNYSITRNGEALSTYQYSIDLENKTFSSSEDYLILDFTSGWTFNTGNNCIFKTGNGCTFDTGYSCIFSTSANCTFTTGNGCTFDTGYRCTFKTGSGCTFNTGGGCTFNTGNKCIFLLWMINTCKFKKYNNSIILDRENGNTYKLTKEFIQLRKITNG